MAAFGWAFMALWLSMLCVVTYIFVRDGGFHQFDPLIETGIMLMFWLFGLGGGGELFARPRTRLTIAGGIVEARQIWPLRHAVERFPAETLATRIVDGRDDEGDPYFTCVVTLPSGRTIAVVESHDRTAVEAAYDRLAGAVGRAGG
jgi:hypothetical protein